MVQSFYPLVALRLVEGLTESDCFDAPGDYERVFSLLKTPRGLRTLEREMGCKIPGVPWELFDRQLAMIEEAGARVVTVYDPDFPACYRTIRPVPPIVFYRGDLNVLSERGVAIVGARAASVSGCRLARTLARDLASMGISVVSGLALGIDSAAHRGALDSGGPTVAVIGTGLDVAYPDRNVGLREEIADHGCVISEQLMGKEPQAFVFPKRNRLISAASHIVVVVEAAQRSGALVTAKWAIEQGRDVGAVPRFPGDRRSAGVNRLLKQGAYPIESASDVLDAVPLLRAGLDARPAAGVRGGAATADLPDTSRAILDAMGGSPASEDELAAHLGREIAAVQRSLLDLEIRGLVARDATGRYYPT